MVSKLRRRLSYVRDYLRDISIDGGNWLLKRVKKTLAGRHPKVSEERLKLAASGLQNAALTLAVAVFVTPHLNTSFVVDGPWLYGTGIVAVLLVMVSQALLDYIPKPKELTEASK